MEPLLAQLEQSLNTEAFWTENSDRVVKVEDAMKILHRALGKAHEARNTGTAFQPGEKSSHVHGVGASIQADLSASNTSVLEEVWGLYSHELGGYAKIHQYIAQFSKDKAIDFARGMHGFVPRKLLLCEANATPTGTLPKQHAPQLTSEQGPTP